MDIRYFPDKESVDALLSANEPVLVLIDFEGKTALVGDIDEYAEHHILLAQAGYDSRDIDKFLRFVADGEGVDWTFVCPPDYKGIKDKQRRIERFYSDGLETAKAAFEKIGISGEIVIPKRYKRHFDAMLGK
ncbi:MAG: hypothetical protein IKR76_11565 [Ruminococcus sp.]|nr:hypothetical protein [Ruminococcus sp.]